MIKHTAGKITKRDQVQMEDHVLCIPKVIEGTDIIPFDDSQKLRGVHIYTCHEDLIRSLRMTVEEAADRYCVLKDEQHQLYVCPSLEEAEKVVTQLGENNSHQVFGSWMVPSFDIDCELRMRADI